MVTVRVTCPKCSTNYEERYFPASAIPEEIGPDEYSDDCVVASCPNCDHLISMIVRMPNSVEQA
nr:hypothetical protein [uncultured Methanoregula sp.]